jgi:type I restriction enzyme M protein
VQRLSSNKLDPVARVVITTIQRLYSMLKGHVLEALGKRDGMLGLIFRKAQNKIQDPAKLRRLIADLIEREEWSSLAADVKGDAYEGLLEKNAQDTKGGAGQYFTPRPLIQAIVEVMDPSPGESICDPACGTGGFLLAAHDWIAKRNPNLSRKQKEELRLRALHGVEIVDSVTRLCAMNLMLHGVGPNADDAEPPPIETRDALGTEPGTHYDLVLTNPPFGKKSSVLIVGEDGETSRESLTVTRNDFWRRSAISSSTSSSTCARCSRSEAVLRWWCPTTSSSRAEPER